MKKDLQYYYSECDIVENEFFEKMENFRKSFSLSEVSQMVIEDYNGRNNCDFKDFVYKYCEITHDFSDIYTIDEIYNYILKNYKVNGKTIEKVLINNEDILEIIKKYENYFYNNPNCNYPKIILENDKFYKIYEHQTDIKM